MTVWQRIGPAPGVLAPGMRQARDRKGIFGGALAKDAVRAALGVLDQGATALGSLIPVILLGRLAGAHELGIFSLAVSVALFAAIASQSLYLSGYPIFRAQDRAASGEYTFHVVLFGLATQAVLVPVYLAALIWGSGDGAYGPVASLTAVAFVTMTVLRSYFRTLSLARQDLVDILVLDTLALLLLSGLLAWLALSGGIGVWNVFLVLAFANALFAVAWLARYAKEMRFRLAGGWPYLVRSIQFGRWAFAGVGFGSMPYYVTPWLLAFARGTEETAIFAAASTIVGLVNHAFLGLIRGIESRTADAFHNGGTAALNETLKRTFSIVLPSLAAIVLVILVAADFFAGLVLPGLAEEAAAAARLLSAALLAGSFRVVIGNGLWAMSLPRATFHADFVRGAVSIGLGALGAYHAGAVGCAFAVLLADAISSLMVAWRYRAETRRRAG